MIKVTKKTEKKVIEYPKLMCNETDLIVLFTSINCGIVVYSNSDRYDVGDYEDSWADGFVDYHGEVTLSNE